MKNRVKNLALIGALGICAPLQSSSLLKVDLKIKIAITNCTGAGSTCNATVNAMGEVVDLDVSKLPVKALGTIDQEKIIKLDLPIEANTQKVFSYIPSVGELAHKKIFLTFENRPQAPGTRLAGKTVINMYRQIEGDKSTQWTDVGEIYTQLPGGDMPAELPFIFKTDGNLVTENPNKVLPDGTFAKVTFVLGKRNVNA